jgi:malonyl-CoA/methylmalonyl-CoA synthetase
MFPSSNVVAALYEGRHPDSPVFIGLDGSVVTTAEAVSQVRRFAGALSLLGVRPGDRVSFRLEKNTGTILLAQACLWLGAVLHPLNNAYTGHELSLLLADAEPALLLTTPEEYDTLRPIAETANTPIASFSETGGSFRLHLENAVESEANPPHGPDGAAVLLYTSGTTGKPKGALITHENLLTSARSLAAVWRLGAGDVLLHALPIYHAHGLLTSVNSMLAGGGAILLLPSFEMTQVLAALGKATVMMGVPTHYARLVDDPAFAAAVGKNLRLAISGSAPLPISLAERFSQIAGVPIVERYGLTEAAIVVAVPPGVGDRTGWVGWPLPAVEIRVATQEGLRSDRGIGILESRGPHIFAGYWRNSEATAAAFTPDGWFITGDIAEIDGSGCVRILGREKDLVISGGLNVYPAEVEEELRRLPGVKEAAVFGVPHPDFGEGVVAAVELSAGEAFDETASIAAVKSRLAAYKAPKRIVTVEAIPRNTMGKFLKARLREEFSGLFSGK